MPIWRFVVTDLTSLAIADSTEGEQNVTNKRSAAWNEQCRINSVEDVATLRTVPDALDLLCFSTSPWKWKSNHNSVPLTYPTSSKRLKEPWRNLDKRLQLTHFINWVYICQYFYRWKVSNNPNLIRRHTAGDVLWIVKSITWFFASRHNRRVKTQHD